MDEACLQAARRGVIFEYIERVSRGTHPNLCDGSVPPLTYSSIHHSLFCYHVWCAGPAAAVQSFLNYFRGMPPTFCWDLMAAVEDVTTEQVRPYFLGREKGHRNLRYTIETNFGPHDQIDTFGAEEN